MSLEEALNFVPAFVLAFFRLAGMFLAAPLFASARVPVRIKVLLALTAALAAAPGIPLPGGLPAGTWQLAAGIGSELIFGLALGTMLNLVFVAVQWAGEVIGQQMGLGLGQVFDPQSGQSGAVVGDVYYIFTLVVFLAAGGHRVFLAGVLESFHHLPPLTPTMDAGLLDVVSGLLASATELAMRLSGPMLVTMLAVDVVLGFLGKTMPQLNVITAGLSLRALVGMAVLVLGLATASEVIRESVLDSLRQVGRLLM
jgi:flagellar biosynthetic protein FliR